LLNAMAWCCGQEAPTPVAEQVAAEPVAPEPEEPKEDPKPFCTIMIVGARGFRNTDWFPGLGKPDCYCEVKRGDKEVFKTKVVQNSMVPKWTEEFQVWEEEDQELEFKLFDSDLTGSDYLGKVKITPNAWMENGFNTEFAMEEAGGAKAFLGLQMKVKDQDEYPPAPLPHFDVEISKQEAATEYGLEVDDQDLQHLQICAIDEGAKSAAFKYNEQQSDAALLVKVSDYILSVNGQTGGAAMLQQFKDSSQSTMKMRLARALDTQVPIENSDQKKKHGLKFPAKMRNNVLVIMDVEDGYVKEYNDTCKKESDKIMKYDRIVTVQGASGKAAELKKSLEKATGKFQIGIERPYPEAATKTPGGAFGH